MLYAIAMGQITRTEARFLRSQVGIGLESDCLLGQLTNFSEILDSIACLKVENCSWWSAKPILVCLMAKCTYKT